MKKTLHLDYVLVCEDIRREVGRKPSAMGIFTEGILVPGFPYTFPKLCFLAHFTVSHPNDSIKFDAILEYPGLAQMVLAKDATIKLRAKRGLTIQLCVSPLTPTKPGNGKLTLRVNGRRFLKRFNVDRAEDARLFDEG